MNGKDVREALKWSLLAGLIVAAWCGTLAIRKARSAEHLSPVSGMMQPAPASAVDKERSSLRPVWVIVVFEASAGKVIGITEFVFPTYDACRATATQVKEKLGLNINPVCYLRWLNSLPGSPV